jgi:hypothetical protein
MPVTPGRFRNYATRRLGPVVLAAAAYKSLLAHFQAYAPDCPGGCCRDPVACAGMSSLVDNVEYRRSRAEETRVLAEAMKDETAPRSCSELLSTTTGWLTAPRATAASERGWTEAVGHGLSAARKPAIRACILIVAPHTMNRPHTTQLGAVIAVIT